MSAPARTCREGGRGGAEGHIKARATPKQKKYPPPGLGGSGVQGFRGLGFRFRVQGFRFRAHGVQGLGFSGFMGLEGSGVWVSGVQGSGVLGFGFGV